MTSSAHNDLQTRLRFAQITDADRAELLWWRADRLLPEIDEGGDTDET